MPAGMRRREAPRRWPAPASESPCGPDVHPTFELVAQRLVRPELRMAVVQEVLADERHFPTGPDDPAEPQVEPRVRSNGGERTSIRVAEERGERQSEGQIEVRPRRHDERRVVSFLASS